jgi:hypothetical protein
MSSRQAFASLSTRSGRLWSRSKERLQRLRTSGVATATCGAVTVTIVVAEADLPRSSTTLQVTVITPGSTPAVLNAAVALLFVRLPPVAEYEYVKGRLCGLTASAVMFEGSPGATVSGLAEQEIVGGRGARIVKLAAQLA